MLLQIAIVKLTKNLEILYQKTGNSISSNVERKEEALNCLEGLIKDAPYLEYKRFIESENYSVLVGYLLNVLCQLSKNDKSRSIRLRSLELIIKLVDKLKSFHEVITTQCSIKPIIFALPGVSSMLFKLIMSDTKLPQNLVVLAIENLKKFTKISFLPCPHSPKDENDEKELCDNLAIRISFLIEYIITNARQLSKDIMFGILDFCDVVVFETSDIMLKKNLPTIVKYIAFITPEATKQTSSFGGSLNLISKCNTIVRHLKSRIDKCGDIELIEYFFKLLEEFENNSEKLLSGELHSNLSILYGLLELMPESSLTTFLETIEKRKQFINILTHLTEFSSDQTFLYVSNVVIDSKALENYSSKNYTSEKRFKHINDEELVIIRNICSFIGTNSNWLCLNDILRNDLGKFSNTSNLFITHLILEGCSKRNDLKEKKLHGFISSYVEQYSERIQEQHFIISEKLKNDIFVDYNDIFGVVVAIETLSTFIEIHIRCYNSPREKTIVLKDLLCLLLNWSSSNSRAISEASLSCLKYVSTLYGMQSSKALIEANIDYIVNGVMLMLDNFAYNTDITNVLAITFKLSSLESFYYFKDVYEKVFRLLGAYQSTSKTKYFALLFYRTVSILSEWKQVEDGKSLISNCTPLESETSLKSILVDLDIKNRVKKLNEELLESKKIQQQMENVEESQEDEVDIVKDVQKKYLEFRKKSDLLEGDVKKEEKNTDEEEKVDSDKSKNKTTDIELTEKILKFCVTLISSNCDETKILALKTAACGIQVLRDHEDTLLPLVHQLWSPLLHRLTKGFSTNLEINLSAFDCLISMGICAKDFIKSRTLESVIPRLCLFLETQSKISYGQKDYGPYCMTIAYKCQLKVLTHLGALAYHIQLAYSNLWQVMRSIFIYMDHNQAPSLQRASKISINYLIALDADCAYYYAKKNNQLKELPFELIFDEV